MKINISPAKITALLALTVIGLTLAGVAGQVSKYYLGHDHLYGGVQFFNLDAERNAPTLYSALALLFCSALLASIAEASRGARRGYVAHWALLSFIFLLMSIIEAAPVYNAVIEPIENKLNLGGLVHSTWILPLLVFFLAYFKFLFALPTKTRALFISAGSLFWTGAVGVELINLRYAAAHGYRNITYAMLTSVEEFLEMASIVIFIYALTSYIDSHLKGTRHEDADVALQPNVVVSDTELLAPPA